MGNPNPSPKTRFQRGNKPVNAERTDARTRISRAFLEQFADDFEANGPDAIKRMRDQDPSSYVRVAVALQPREVQHRHFLDGVEDTELAHVIDELKAVVAARAESVH